MSMHMRNYLTVVVEKIKNNQHFIAVLHFTVTVEIWTMSITYILKLAYILHFC